MSLLPRGAAYALGDALAAVVYVATLWREPARVARGRGVVRSLRLVFGRALDDRAARRLVWAYARHLAWVAIEVLRLPLLTARRAARAVDARALDDLRRLAAEGRGVIVASGHMGHWELMGYVPALLGVRSLSLARPVPHPGVAAWLSATRAASGQRVLAKHGALWALKKELDRGGIVGLIVDENARDGVFVPFCGVLAATNPSVAQLQRWTGAPIAVMTCQRLGPGRHRLHLWRVVRPDERPRSRAPRAPSGMRDLAARGPGESAAPAEPAPPQEGDDRRRVLAEVAAGLEEALRAYPAQWLWTLRRWETRPPGETPGPGGLPPRCDRA